MHRFFADLSLRLKLSLYILALVGFEAILIFAYFPQAQHAQARQALGDKAEGSASLLAYARAGPTKFGDKEGADLLLEEARKARGFAFAVVRGSGGKEITALGADEASRARREETIEASRQARLTPEYYVTERNIVDVQSQRVGNLELGF